MGRKIKAPIIQQNLYRKCIFLRKATKKPPQRAAVVVAFTSLGLFAQGQVIFVGAHKTVLLVNGLGVICDQIG